MTEEEQKNRALLVAAAKAKLDALAEKLSDPVWCNPQAKFYTELLDEIHSRVRDLCRFNDTMDTVRSVQKKAAQ
jgi:hypothetical protein